MIEYQVPGIYLRVTTRTGTKGTVGDPKNHVSLLDSKSNVAPIWRLLTTACLMSRRRVAESQFRSDQLILTSTG